MQKRRKIKQEKKSYNNKNKLKNTKFLQLVQIFINLFNYALVFVY